MKIIEKMAARNSDARSMRPIVIACLGDSVTHGCFDLIVDSNGDYVPHYMPDHGYVAKVGRKLNTLFPAAAVTMLNAGISGDSSRGGLERLERDVLCFNPDLVIVNLGLNDAMNADPDAGVIAYEKNMTEIFKRIIENGSEGMLVTPNYMCSYVSALVVGDKLRAIAADAATIQNNGVLTRYVATARSVAERLSIPVADAYLRWDKMWRSGVDTTVLLSNGINHPTEEMHDLFVDEILRQLFE